MTVLAWLRRLRTALASCSQVSSIDQRAADEALAAEYLNRALTAAREAVTAAELSESLRCYSGYVREAALVRCVELSSFDNLPDVVVRLNDWVPQVRRQAQITLKTLLVPETVPQMLTILPSVRALRHKSRADHSAWIIDFGRALLAANTAAVIDGVLGPDAQVRRACFELLLQYHPCHASALIERVLRSRIDNVLATRAVERCATLSAAQRGMLYELALRSPYATVRAEALRAMLAGEPSDEKDKLSRGFLLDAKTRVRAVAGQYLSQQGIDRRSFYRELLAQPELPRAHRLTAIVALAGLTISEDVVLFRQQANDGDPSVRRAALAALLRAAPEDKDTTTLMALQDADPQVRRLALHAITRRGAYLDFDTIAYVLEGANDVPLLLQFARVDWLVAAAVDRSTSGHPPTSKLVRELLRWRTSPQGEQVWPQSCYNKGILTAAVFDIAATIITDSNRPEPAR